VMERVSAVIAVCVCLFLVAVGCVGSQMARRDAVFSTVTLITLVADPAYEAAVLACDAHEQVVEDNQALDAEMKNAEIARIRAVCDRVFDGFLALRRAQVATASAAKAAADGKGPWAVAEQAAAGLAPQWAAIADAIRGVPWLGGVL
jgi:hypothetical protein